MSSVECRVLDAVDLLLLLFSCFQEDEGFWETDE